MNTNRIFGLMRCSIESLQWILIPLITRPKDVLGIITQNHDSVLQESSRELSNIIAIEHGEFKRICYKKFSNITCVRIPIFNRKHRAIN